MDRRKFLQLAPTATISGCLSVGSGTSGGDRGMVECEDSLQKGTSTGPAGGDWPTAQHDMYNTTATNLSGPTGCVETRWSWSFKEHTPTENKPGTYTAPVLYEDVVYHADEWLNEILLRAFNPTTGNQLWQFSVGTRHTARKTPTIVDDVAYLVSGGLFYAVNVETHKLNWKKRLVAPRDDPDLGVPRVESGTIFVADKNGVVFALDAATGNQKWRFDTVGISPSQLPDRMDDAVTEAHTTGAIHEPIAVAGGLVFVSSWDYNLYALDAGTGEEIWRYSVHESSENLDYPRAPAIVNGNVYVQTADSRLFVLNAQSGEELWRFNELGPASNGVSPAVDNETVYISHQRFESETYLYALDRETGEMQWRTHVYPPQVGPAVDAETLYQTLLDEFVAFDKDTGKEKWRMQMTGATFSHPAITDDAVFISDTSGYLYAVW